ncbi:MAG: CopD family protein [Alphaproteobacteria bacterium]|nr:CopD family protein [Alphaproteobacteria bacterium]
MRDVVLLVHVLAATVWTGGHLVLALTVLPRALAARDPGILLAFERGYERIGMPALLVQVATGVWLASGLLPDWREGLGFASPVATLLTLKLMLLAATVLAAIDARLRLIPALSPATLPAMARRIVLVTVLSVGFVAVGVAFRGGLMP